MTGKYKTMMLRRPCANDHKIVSHVNSQIVLIGFKEVTSIKTVVKTSPTLPPFFQTDIIRDIEECMRALCPVAFRLVKMFEVGTWMKECRETLYEHVYPHCLKFIKRNSKVVMYYEKWSKNEWMGPVDILKVISSSSGL